VARFGLAAGWGKIREAAALKWRLRGVPYRMGCWPVEAQERDGGLRVTLREWNALRQVECDYLACGFFLVPNLELPMLLGCRLQADGVAANEWQETSVANIYGAGEVTGIGGLEKSLIEGEIAGLAASGDRGAAERLFGARARAWRFAAALRGAFALREELREIATDDAIVCRCEDVTVGRVRGYSNMRETKLQTRCGMGPCQGRVCGAACEFLFGWRDGSVRAPIFPVGVGALRAMVGDAHPTNEIPPRS
jgi:NADPH-dependent 2,4-dienoyl-CoA reductase/sulfur reductase-like enzyme